jgi:hypothetical protein
MKTKILLSVAIFFFTAIAANAQITEGKYLLGGSFNYYNSTGSNTNSINTNIQFGKVIKENTVAGVIGSVAASKNTFAGSRYSIYNYSAGVFYRKYKPLGKNFYFLQEADAVFQHSRGFGNYFDNVGQSLYANSNGVMLSYIPGISYSATKRMQIELTMPNLVNVSFTNIKTVNNRLPQGVSPQKANTFYANVNLNSNLLNNFGIGFKFLLGK